VLTNKAANAATNPISTRPIALMFSLLFVASHAGGDLGRGSLRER